MVTPTMRTPETVQFHCTHHVGETLDRVDAPARRSIAFADHF